MTGDLSKISYSSSEQLSRIYFSGCLAAHLGALEGKFCDFFGMNGRTEWLEFDTDYLFRTESQQRIEGLAKAVQGGIRTPNEARRIEGLNPVIVGMALIVNQQQSDRMSPGPQSRGLFFSNYLIRKSPRVRKSTKSS